MERDVGGGGGGEQGDINIEYFCYVSMNEINTVKMPIWVSMRIKKHAIK